MKHLVLADWIQVDRSVARSINLERDATNQGLLKRFQVTPMASEVLNRLVDALEGEAVNAWSLTGPYGTGKTAFCNFLISLGCGVKEERAICMEKLRNADAELADRFKSFIKASNDGIAPYIGVRAVSRYESLNSTLIRALFDSLEVLLDRSTSTNLKRLHSDVAALMVKEWPPTKDVITAYEQLARFSKHKIFLVVDEFGKNLEYQVHNSARGDIFALQALAESRNVFLWVCLHQAFSEYASSLSRVQKEEWQKIQGRFEDKSYIEPPSRTFELIRESLSLTSNGKIYQKLIGIWAREMFEAIRPLKIENWPQINEKEIAQIYPIHPLCAFFMGELTRRFAQNDRTLFSFLSSGEPRAFSGFLRREHTISHNRIPTLGLEILYDYFSEISLLRYSDRAENQRWLEIQALLASRGNLENEKIRILKVIGILNLLSSLPGVRASEEMIHAALATDYYGDRRSVQHLLSELRGAQVVLYRGYASEYRLWEGSDFDLDAELVQARSQISLRPVQEVLSDIAPRANVIAARHSYQSGTLREFAVRWCTEDDLDKLKNSPLPEQGSDGIIWLVLGKQQTPNHIEEIAHSGVPVIVAYSPCINQVRQLALEAAATKFVINAPQLQRDGVARKEARHRAAQADAALSSFIEQIFTPGNRSTSWYAGGKQQSVSSPRQLSGLVSTICDHIYCHCPRINNEMLNCEKLSGAGAKARREVAEALANAAYKENLGLSGFGPEVAIYRTVFKDTGLHVQTPDGWQLSAPDAKKQPQFAFVWNEIDKLLSDADNADKPVSVRLVLDVLKRPPLGLREGPAPLLLIHYLLIHADDVAVYEEGVFKPFFGDAEIILLMKRPEIFSLRRYLPTGIRKEVVQTYLQVINTEALSLVGSVRNQTILSIVVPLTEFIKTLPEYTLATRELSPNAMRLRNALVNAREPQQLLFSDIPQALGLATITTASEPSNSDLSKELREILWDALTELRDKFSIFASKVQAIMMQQLAIGASMISSLEVFQQELHTLVDPLVDKCADIELKPILATIRQDGDVESWALKVAAQIMKKPVMRWRDGDLEPFAVRLGELRQRIEGLIKLARFAESHGRLDAGSRFVSMTRPDGRIYGKVIQFDSDQMKILESSYQNLFEKQNSVMRHRVLAMLLETMEKEGELE